MKKVSEPPRRTEFYLGPDKEIMPETLDKLEVEGGWICQPKMDGMFASLTVGTPNVVKSRDARTGPISGDNSGGFAEMDLLSILPEGTILIGELEAASQWAADSASKRGYRVFYLFDCIQIGQESLRDLTTVQRYARLRELYLSLGQDQKIAKKFVLLPTVLTGFRSHYNAWLEAGLEGCVCKKEDATYHTSRMDGKTDNMVRCKKHVTEDYVLIGLGMTPGGKTSAPQVNGLWGLYVDGKMKQVMQTGAPPELLVEENIGKLVCEYKGWLKFSSGALRHAQFVRVRPDKVAEMCVLR